MMKQSPDRHDAATKRAPGDTLAGLRLFELERRIGRMEAFLLGGLAMLGSLTMSVLAGGLLILLT